MWVFIRGIPTIMYVDDYIPFVSWASAKSPSGENAVNEGQPADNSLWSIMVEKVWAKITGSYDRIGAGGDVEGAYSTLTGGAT